MKYKLQITKAELVPDKYGKHIKITMVKLMNAEGKYIKFAKLEDVIDILRNAIIEFNPDDYDNN